jgi:hypothetical protein
MNTTDAHTWNTRTDRITNCCNCGERLYPETQVWIDGINEDIYCDRDCCDAADSSLVAQAVWTDRWTVFDRYEPILRAARAKYEPLRQYDRVHAIEARRNREMDRAG